MSKKIVEILWWTFSFQKNLFIIYKDIELQKTSSLHKPSSCEERSYPYIYRGFKHKRLIRRSLEGYAHPKGEQWERTKDVQVAHLANFLKLVDQGAINSNKWFCLKKLHLIQFLISHLVKLSVSFVRKLQFNTLIVWYLVGRRHRKIHWC